MKLGVGAAEVAVGGGHAALASIGKFEVAKVVGVVLSSCGHFLSILSVNIHCQEIHQRIAAQRNQHPHL
jgi:hypothetical protein